MSGMCKRISVLLIIIITMALLTGCGQGGGFAFNALDVNNKDIPEYEVSSEVSLDKDNLKMIWTTIQLKDVTEEQAKKVLADYIEKNKELDYIESMVKTRDDSIYKAKYYKVEEAAKANPPGEKIEEYPAVVYDKQENKK